MSDPTPTRPGLRWALLGLEALAAAWLWAVALPAHADAINGGSLFAAYLLLFGWSFAAAGAFARGTLRGVSWGALLLGPAVAALFAYGARGAESNVVTLSVIPIFSLATLLWTAAAVPETHPATDARWPAWAQVLGLLLGGAALAWGMAALQQWTVAHLTWMDDLTSLSMLWMPRGAAANDIGGTPFHQWNFMVEPLFFAGGLFFVLSKRHHWPLKRSLGALFVLALLGKFALASLSSQGLGVVGLKITSVNTNFYALAKLVDEKGVYGFLKAFNGLQAGLGAHGNTHPPLPVYIYWVLRHLSFDHPSLVALTVMALSASAIWPLYHWGRQLGGEETGWAAASLFVTTPLSLLLGNAGIDSIVFAAVAFIGWMLGRAILERRPLWALGGGALMAVASLCSYGSSASLVFLGSWGLLALWRRERAWSGFAVGILQVWGLFAAGLLAVHALVWLASGGHFNYLVSVSTAQGVHGQANFPRTYEVWAWANFILYGAYAGMGLLLCYFWGLGRGLFLADTRDATAFISAAFLLTVALSAYGRAEVQRQYLFGAVFMLPTAALVLPKGKDGRLLTGPWAVALALNLANAVLVQVKLLDFW